MQHIYRDATDFDCFSLGQLARAGSLVNVAPGGGCRSKGAHFPENVDRTRAARVDDVLRAVQGCDGFGPKQSVGIGNDADHDGGLSSQASAFDLNSSACSSRHGM